MAGKTSTLTVKIVSDAKDASRGFDDAESRVAGFQRGLDKASVAAGGVLLGLGAVAVSAFNAASELQQASGALDATFGDAAASMHDLAAAAAQTTGLAEADYSNMASVIGSQLRNMGVAQADLAPSTDALITKGADLAAQFGGSTSEAVEALSSLLRGERDPIERYGVSISQAGIDAEIAALGLDTSTEAAKKNATLQATLALLTDQTATSTGAFARENDTAAGAQQRMNAELENAKAKLGEQLLPVVADAATKLSNLAGWVEKNSGLVKTLGVVVGVTAGAVWALNIALAANPFVLIALAIGAVVAGLIIAYDKVGWFRDYVQQAGRQLGTAWDRFTGVLSWVWDKLSAILDLIKKIKGDDDFSGIGKVKTPTHGAARPAAAAPLFGAARGAAGLFGATSSSGGGAGPTAAGGLTAAATTVINVTVQNALDPLAVGRQITQVLRDYAGLTGQRVAVNTA